MSNLIDIQVGDKIKYVCTKDGSHCEDLIIAKTMVSKFQLAISDGEFTDVTVYRPQFKQIQTKSQLSDLEKQIIDTYCDMYKRIYNNCVNTIKLKKVHTYDYHDYWEISNDKNYYMIKVPIEAIKTVKEGIYNVIDLGL